MPTIITHPVLPLAMAYGAGRTIISTRLLLAGTIASVLPDLDVVAFRFGIPYAATFGHRGFSHSVLFAFVVACIGAGMSRWLNSTSSRTFFFLFFATVSHGVLDAFTTGGLGIAFLWPWSDARFFAPVQVIKVSPFGVSRFLSPRGVAVLKSELLWVWLPSCIVMVGMVLTRRLASQRQ
ncbi:MAG: metal-dependent hydrolase [Trichlorobacter sp.]|uniref:metal-dependent hydrolase n=1 Tax=Trichlorobacter sp. TaxID=2911007 RepID=UPI00255DF765|nr:metal-dependent hydrolase [Trichlorobacter sp.]MDK9719287.1 metal-dependent hydrolase [Trichlorobacter sp.]